MQLVRSRARARSRCCACSCSPSTAAGAVRHGAASSAATSERVSGPIGEANDFAYLLASVLPFARLPGAPRPALRGSWWVLCCGAAGRWRCSGRSRAARSSALAAVVLWAVATRRTRVGGVLAGTGRGRRRAAAGLHAVAAADRGAPGGQEPGRERERRVARGVLAAALRDGGRPPAARRRARAASGSRAATTSATTRSTSTNPVVHNAYLEVLAEGGVPTLIAFLAFIAGSWRLTGAGAKTVRRRRGPRRAAARPPPSRRRWWSRSCPRTSCRCRSRCRCGCSAASPRCSRCRPARTVKVALVTSIPHGGPARARRAARARPRPRSASTCARWRPTRRGSASRRSARASRCIPLARPFDPVGAVRVHRFVRGADVVHSHDRRSGLWVRLGAGAGALRVHTLHGLPEPYLARSPGLRARLAYGGLERALRDGRARHALARDGAAAGRAPRLHGEIVAVVPNGVDVPTQPVPRGELVGTLSAHEPVKGPRRASSTRCRSCSRGGRRRASRSSAPARWRRSCASARAGLPVAFPGPRARRARRCAQLARARAAVVHGERARSRCWRRWRRASRRWRPASAGSRRRRHGRRDARPARRPAALAAAILDAARRPARRADRAPAARGVERTARNRGALRALRGRDPARGAARRAHVTARSA